MDILEQFIVFITADIGKLSFLLFFFGTIIIYVMTKRGSVLFLGFILSLIIGVGIGFYNGEIPINS